MANKKISELNTLISVDNDDVLPIVDISENETKKVTISNILSMVFPIGRGFIDFTDTDYTNYLGFTWERELVGMTAVGLDTSQTEFNTIGKTGGEKGVTLSIDEMPRHSHNLYTIQPNSPSGWGIQYYFKDDGTGPNDNTDRTTEVGNSQPHNNLQPYKVVAYWKRVA